MGAGQGIHMITFEPFRRGRTITINARMAAPRYTNVGYTLGGRIAQTAITVPFVQVDTPTVIYPMRIALRGILSVMAPFASHVAPAAGRIGPLGSLVLGIMLVGTWLTATRPASLGDLQRALGAGQATEVHLVGELPPGATGMTTVDIEWDGGFLDRYATVWQESPDLQHPEPSSSYPVVGLDLREELSAATPTGELVMTSEDVRTGSQGILFGWRVATWVALVAFLWSAPVVITLITAPEPRRATRWAWFWLMLGTGPFALMLYPLVGLPRAGQPSDATGRRLTGGWAFLIMVLLAPAFWP